LDQPVGQGGFPVVDMGYDGKIADFIKIGHRPAYGLILRFGQDTKRSRRPKVDIYFASTQPNFADILCCVEWTPAWCYPYSKNKRERAGT